MLIQEIVQNLYTNPKSNWMKDVENTEIQPFVIQRWLVGNDHIRTQVRWLDKYVFTLPSKMYLSLAWSIIPKSKTVPYRTDSLTIDESNDPYLAIELDKYDFLITRIRKHFKLGDNDFNSLKPQLMLAIKKHLSDWFIYYGAEKIHWKRFNMNFNMMKCRNDKSKIKSLSSYGLK